MLELTKLKLRTHDDSRGNLTEIFREEWPGVPPIVQWNFVRSEANVLRGMHVHVTHVDYLIVLEGRILVGLCDLRESGSGRGEIVEMPGDNSCALVIPNGVAHGFYFPESAAYIYGMTHYWDPVNDEFGCRWDDPALAVPWPAQCAAPRLSERDEAAGPLAVMLGHLRAAGFKSR